MRRALLALALIALPVPPARGQQAIAGTAVIVVGQEPNVPVPTVGTGRANADAADLLFLRLARPGADLRTSGDRGFQPELAGTGRGAIP